MDDINVEDEENFIPTWPMLSLIEFLGDGTGNVPYAIRDNGDKGVLLFSEELFAERFRDLKQQKAIFVRAFSWKELGDQARKHASGFGATHYVIDNLANEPDSYATWLSFQDIWDRRDNQVREDQSEP